MQNLTVRQYILTDPRWLYNFILVLNIDLIPLFFKTILFEVSLIRDTVHLPKFDFIGIFIFYSFVFNVFGMQCGSLN